MRNKIATFLWLFAVLLVAVWAVRVCTQRSSGISQQTADELAEQAFKAGFMVGAHHRGQHRIENFKFEAILDSIIDSIRTAKTDTLRFPTKEIKKADR